MANVHPCRITALFGIIFIIPTPKVCPALTNLNIPDRPTRSYVNLADINLGALFAISGVTECGRKLRVPILQQMVEAVVFAVDKINRNDSILPHVKLGFVLLDECSKESIAAAQSLRFLPRIPRGNFCRQTTRRNTYGQMLDEYYDVVGVIGPLRSSNSIAVSNVLGPAHVPQISFLSTSDVLSRKSVHPYFMRVIPPDAYQMKAILRFISRHGWSYFSVLYSEGSYGEPAYEVIKKSARYFGLCVAAQHKLYVNMQVDEFRDIILDLMKYTYSRVVLLVGGDHEMVKTFQAVYDVNATGRFIWIGTDGWAERVSSLNPTYRNSSLGSFTTTFYAPPAEEFFTYFQKQKPSQSNNPWFNEFWERMFNCSFRLKTCNESLDIKTSPDYTDISQAVYGIDAVYAYAHALHRLLTDTCPGVKGARARACVNGSALLRYLKQTSFNGETGFVDFDENGDRMGKYVIKQLLNDETISQHEVVIVDVKNSYYVETLSNAAWGYVRPLEVNFSQSVRFPGTKYHMPDDTTPISVCSRLCEVGEQKIQREPPCCWDCRKCRENEILVLNLTMCQQCPEFSWPDASTNLTSCLPIEPTYPRPSDPLVIIVLCFGVSGIVFSALVLIIYIEHRSARVIKASSRELSFFQLGAILFGYLTMMIYTMRPTNQLCAASFFMFSLSFNWLYAPLLTKTIRIYRIFHAADKGRITLRVVSPFSQLVIALIIILGQIVICCIVSVLSNPRARLTSPSKTEKHVELYCDFTRPGMMSFIAYNLTLVCLCSVFAFKTRKLPDNFNESRFISMCVFTTLVIWMVIIPSFVTASREYLRSILLAVALLLNHTVALIFLFVTRIYAIYWVEELRSEPGGGGTSGSVFPGRSHSFVTPINAITTTNTSTMNNFLRPGPSH